ncbi:hypothetical protein [Roseixanthobacter glucoisosaccharinicivorans]|uniref:hypothetical protein n=1 Tax=Roseixanthobacter glucoisosaccharinicivorans TaxID=3119923 RepID=UPI00372B950A
MSTLWTGHEEHLLRSLLSKGLTIPNISVHFREAGFDRSPSAIADKIKRLHLQRPSRINVVAENKAPRDGWERCELSAMNEAFCSAMEAAGYRKANPEMTEFEQTVPMRAAPKIVSLGSGWQI